MTGILQARGWTGMDGLVKREVEGDGGRGAESKWVGAEKEHFQAAGKS